jgi:tRNA(Glu) U13 pseudouridine synthase TruD
LLGNQFTIRLRATDTITDYVKVQIESWLQQIAYDGFPNLFGQQRFGKRNLGRAIKLFASGRSLREDDFELKFKLQAFPSIYFNTQAIARYQAGDMLLDGDILTRRRDLRTREVWVYDQESKTIQLFDYARTKEYHIDKDICYPDFVWKTIDHTSDRSPTGLMIGANMLLCPNNTPARQYDRDTIKSADMLAKADTARHYHLFGIRRPLITRPTELSYGRDGDDLQLSFWLPTGSYATILLGRLFRDIDEETCVRNKWRIETID